MKSTVEYVWNNDERNQMNNMILNIMWDMEEQGMNYAEIYFELNKLIEDCLYDFEQIIMDRNEKVYKQEN